MVKRGLKLVLLIVIIAVLIAAVYFTFFFYYSCKDNDLACFKAHQESCAKTKFTNGVEDAVWAYTIKGKSGTNCKINVGIVEIKKGAVDLTKLEGKNMDCLIPLKSTVSPEGDITKCHGELKEEIQNLIIQKLHNYVVSNIGKIDAELERVDSSSVSSVVQSNVPSTVQNSTIKNNSSTNSSV
jgi:hypothetical protein